MRKGKTTTAVYRKASLSLQSDGVIELDPERLQTFAAHLSTLAGGRIQKEQLWKSFHVAFPHRPRGAELRWWFLLALRHAEGAGVIRLPVEHGRRWDRTADPPIPRSVDRMPLASQAVERSWQQFPWHPRLAWVADLAWVTPEQDEFLHQVHQGLVGYTFQHPAPLKYRSLQLTGDEKRLGKLARTALFGPGRLDLDLLGCLQEVPPLVWESVGPPARAIVFENQSVFRVAHLILAQLADPPYGIIGFGAGAGFVQSVRYFRMIGRPVESIEYVGDLDRPGLRTARAAAQTALTDGLPPVIPAPGVHQAMLQSARRFHHPLGFPYTRQTSGKDDEFLAAWLPEDLRSDVLSLLQAGNRVPEEVLGPDEFFHLWRS